MGSKNSGMEDFFEDELRGLVELLREEDKVELIRFMVLSFVKASRLYYKSIGVPENSYEEKIKDELVKLKLAFEMRLDQTEEDYEEQLKEFEQPNNSEFDQFFSDAMIDLYFLMQRVSKNEEM